MPWAGTGEVGRLPGTSPQAHRGWKGPVPGPRELRRKAAISGDTVGAK